MELKGYSKISGADPNQNSSGQLSKRYKFQGIDLSDKQAKQLQMINALGSAGYIDNNDASKILYNTFLQPEQDFGETMGFADALFQMGNTDGANNVISQIGRNMGFDPAELGLTPGQDEMGMDGMPSGNALTQRYNQAMQGGNMQAVKQMRENNPDYNFNYDPTTGADVSIKGGGLGEMLFGKGKGGAVADTFLQKMRDNLIGTSNDPTAYRAQRLATSFGGIRPLFETIFETAKGDSDASGYLEDRLRRQKMREQQDLMMSSGF